MLNHIGFFRPNSLRERKKNRINMYIKDDISVNPYAQMDIYLSIYLSIYIYMYIVNLFFFNFVQLFFTTLHQSK